jgi:hypothetical protein
MIQLQAHLSTMWMWVKSQKPLTIRSKDFIFKLILISFILGIGTAVYHFFQSPQLKFLFRTRYANEHHSLIK